MKIPASPAQPGRRRLLQALAAAAAAGATGLAPVLAAPAAPAFDTRGYSARARRIVERSLVIDMLAPLRLDLDESYYAHTLTPQEIAAFRASRISGMHNAFGIGGEDAHAQVLRYMTGWYNFAARHSELFTLVAKAADIDRAREQGKIAVIMGVQNAEHFRTVEDVKTFRTLGLRCSQLTYNSQNLLGSGSTERVDGGLSDYGLAIVAAMNENRLLVDVSHCGDRTTLDAIEASKGPIAITHSNCRALNDHPRLKTDEAIRKLAAKGGVMGITGVRNFVRASEPTTVDHIVDHVDHVAKLVGIEHVGIGSDADLYGYDDMPPEQLKALRGGYKSSYAFRDKLDTDGFDHPLKTYDLAEALIRRGYSDANIEAVLGGNFRRLLGEVWG